MLGIKWLRELGVAALVTWVGSTAAATAWLLNFWHDETEHMEQETRSVDMLRDSISEVRRKGKQLSATVKEIDSSRTGRLTALTALAYGSSVPQVYQVLANEALIAAAMLESRFPARRYPDEQDCVATRRSTLFFEADYWRMCLEQKACDVNGAEVLAMRIRADGAAHDSYTEDQVRRAASLNHALRQREVNLRKKERLSTGALVASGVTGTLTLLVLTALVQRQRAEGTQRRSKFFGLAEVISSPSGEHDEGARPGQGNPAVDAQIGEKKAVAVRASPQIRKWRSN